MRGNEGRCGRNEVGIVAAFVEQRPRRATLVHRVENDVGFWVVERLHEHAGQVKDDRAMTARAKLRDVAAQLGRLAGAGGADEHGMALFEPPRIGDAGDRVWNVDAPVDPIEDRSLGDEFGDVRRIVFGALGAELASVVAADSFDEHVTLDQQGAAVVAFLEHVAAALVCPHDEPHDDRCCDEGRHDECRQEDLDRLRPGMNDMGFVGDVADRNLGHDAVWQGQVDEVEFVPADPRPDGGIELHQVELEFMLGEAQPDEDIEQDDERPQPYPDGHLEARPGHLVLTGEKLRTAGEIARVAGDPPPRGMVLYGRRLTVEPDVAATHGTSPGAPSRLREAGVRRRRDRV